MSALFLAARSLSVTCFWSDPILIASKSELLYIGYMGEKDKSYKLLFSHAQMVKELLRDFVREDWVKKLDFSTLKKYNNSFVDENLKERFDDVIWTLKWGKKRLYVYILLEFQSEIDYHMSVRMMTYLGMLYQDLLKTGAVKSGNKLPPVLPILLYNGKPRWSAPVNVFDCVIKSPRGLEKYQPRLEYLLIDEGAYDVYELESRKSLVSALFQLERQQTPEQVREIVGKLIDWLGSPENQSLRRAFTVWLGRIILPSRYPDDKIPEFHDLQEVNAMLSETVKSWPAQWLQEGMEKGDKFRCEKIALKMIAKGKSFEEISEITELSIQQIEQLAQKNKVSESPVKYKSKRKSARLSKK
jgi:predicted transposase/invertase (TIGR01784 family)